MIHLFQIFFFNSHSISLSLLTKLPDTETQILSNNLIPPIKILFSNKMELLIDNQLKEPQGIDYKMPYLSFLNNFIDELFDSNSD